MKWGIVIFSLILINIVNATPVVNLNKTESNINILTNVIPTVQLESINYTGNLSNIYVNRAGDTMFGNLNLGNNIITSKTSVVDNQGDSSYFPCYNWTYDSGAELLYSSMCKIGNDLQIDSDLDFNQNDIKDVNTIATNIITGNIGGAFPYTLQYNITIGAPSNVAIVVDSVRSFWAFKYLDGALPSTGLYFDTTNQWLSLLTYLNEDLCHITLGGMFWCKNGANLTSINIRNNISSNEHELVLDDDVNITGNLDVNGNITGSFYYAGIYNHTDIPRSLNFAVQNVWYNFTGGICGLYNGFECDGVNGVLTATTGSVYSVRYASSGIGQNNHVYHAAIFVNNQEQNNTESHTQTDAQVIKALTGIGHIRVNQGDNVSLRVQDTSGTGTAQVYNWNFILERIGN